MLAEERQNAIVAQVNEKGSVLVKNLSKEFQVTEDSIRKDLTLLEKKGLLKKTYGGAVKVRVNVHDFYVSHRKERNIEDKQKIAKKAMELIQEGDMIFLDISTSNLELAKLLLKSDWNVTVVTNMIEIMLLFMNESKVKLIFIGGNMSSAKEGFVGALTNQELEKYRFDKVFMGVVGVDLEENRVATYDAEDASTKSAILKAGNKAYMMVETRKFNAEGNCKYAKVSDFTGAILDHEPDLSVKKVMKKYEIGWL